jgi:hypothetical protein
MSSQGWRPIVYLGTTAGGVLLVMLIAHLVVLVAYPDGISRSEERSRVKMIYVAGGVLALGAGMAINQALKRYFRHYFGTYLDDPDAAEEPLPPPQTKVCLHCAGVFPAYRNDLHAAGFCSPGCREHYSGK